MLRYISWLIILLVLTACNNETQTRRPPQEVSAQSTAAQNLTKTLIHNGRIYTMDQGFSTADAMLFDSSGRIHNVGDEEDMLKAFPDAMQINLEGKTVIPGLIDTHAHLFGLAVSYSQAQLRDTGSKEEIIRVLREQEKNLAENDWLLGRGWDQNDWPVKEFPTAGDLDAAFPERPVWLRRIDGHAGWANSAALALG